MSLYIQVDGSAEKLDRVRFASRSVHFSASIGEVSLEAPLKIDGSYNETEIYVFGFRRKNLLESDIYQVFEKRLQKRVGWLIPVLALTSSDHGYAGNRHYEKYAGGLLRVLTNSSLHPRGFCSNAVRDRLTLTDFFSDDVAFLAISRSAAHEIGGFQLEDWLPGLLANGYVFTPLVDSTPVLPIYIGASMDAKPTSLRIAPTRAPIVGDMFIRRMLVDLIPTERSEWVRFFFLYQIVEHIFSRMLQIEQRRIAEKFTATTRNSSDVKELISEMNSLGAEKKLLALLRDGYIASNIAAPDLVLNCNSFLLAAGEKTREDAFDAIYSVRNALVHRFASCIDFDFREISREFLLFVLEMMSEYDEGSSEPVRFRGLQLFRSRFADILQSIAGRVRGH